MQGPASRRWAPGRDTAAADAGVWGVDGGPGPDATGASGTAELEAQYGTAPGPVSVSLDGQANDARFSIARGARDRVVVRLLRRPRGRDVTASFVSHRARPPASERTTLWAFRLR
jgi:hypothetical protein